MWYLQHNPVYTTNTHLKSTIPNFQIQIISIQNYIDTYVYSIYIYMNSILHHSRIMPTLHFDPFSLPSNDLPSFLRRFFTGEGEGVWRRIFSAFGTGGNPRGKNPRRNDKPRNSPRENGWWMVDGWWLMLVFFYISFGKRRFSFGTIQVIRGWKDVFLFFSVSNVHWLENEQLHWL